MIITNAKKRIDQVVAYYYKKQIYIFRSDGLNLSDLSWRYSQFASYLTCFNNTILMVLLQKKLISYSEIQ